MQWFNPIINTRSFYFLFEEFMHLLMEKKCGDFAWAYQNVATANVCCDQSKRWSKKH